MSWTTRIATAAGLLSLMGCASNGRTSWFGSALGPAPTRGTPLYANRPPQLTTHRPEELLLPREVTPSAYTITILKKRVQIIAEYTRNSYVPTVAMLIETGLLAWDVGSSKESKLARRARDQRPRGKLR